MDRGGMMKKRINIFQFSLETVVILLLVVTMVSSIVNQNLRNRKMASNMSEEEIVGTTYLKFPSKPHTQALYENQEEKEEWNSKTTTLKRPRILAIEGHPFTGNNNYQPLTDPIQEMQDEITYSPFDFTQKVDLYVKLPDDKKTTWSNDSYEPISLDQEKTPETLTNHLLCFKLHLPDLYNNAKFPFHHITSFY